MCKNSINLTFSSCQNWCAELMFFLNPIVLSLKSSLQKHRVRTELVRSNACCPLLHPLNASSPDQHCF